MRCAAWPSRSNFIRCAPERWCRADAGNYVRGDERVDLLYASRPVARRLLASAAESKTSLGDLRVVSAEGLIGFKLQALANDPRRTRDLEDIRALLQASFAKTTEPPLAANDGADVSARVDEDPFRTLDDLMAVVEALCPTWPQRGTLVNGGRMLL